MLYGQRILLVSIIIASALGATLFISDFRLGINSSPSLSGPIKHDAIACVEVKHIGDSDWTDLGCKHNYYSPAGQNITRDLLLVRSGVSAVNVIGLGNGTTGANSSDITITNSTYSSINATIPDCGLSPTTGTTTNIQTPSNSGNFSVTNTFTNSCGSNTINQTGLFNASNVGDSRSNYFAGVNLSTVATLANGDQINVTWYIWSS